MCLWTRTTYDLLESFFVYSLSVHVSCPGSFIRIASSGANGFMWYADLLYCSICTLLTIFLSRYTSDCRNSRPTVGSAVPAARTSQHQLLPRSAWNVMRHHGLLALFLYMHVAYTTLTHIVGDLLVHQWPIHSILRETYISLYILMRAMYRGDDVLA